MSTKKTNRRKAVQIVDTEPIVSDSGKRLSKEDLLRIDSALKEHKIAVLEAEEINQRMENKRLFIDNLNMKLFQLEQDIVKLSGILKHKRDIQNDCKTKYDILVREISEKYDVSGNFIYDDITGEITEVDKKLN